MKNAILVQVVDSYGPNKFLPLAVAYQWLNATSDLEVAAQWNLLDVLIEKTNIDQYINQIDQEVTLVAMSCYVWNWNYNSELARRIKQKWPKCIVVIGGPEVSKNDSDLIRSNPWFDVAILGENETAFQTLLRNTDLEAFTATPGVVTKYTQEIVQPTRTQDINKIPSPILSGFYDKVMHKYREKNIPVQYWQVTWESMRGCPYHCAFCDIGDAYWNKATWFELDRIYKEIDWMAQNKIEYLSVCDSNWGIHPRDVEISRYLIETKKKTGYPRILDVTWAKNNPDRVQKIMQLDIEAGTNLIRGLNLSLQSMDQNTLRINNRFNLQDHALCQTLNWFKENRVPTFTELIWPLPGETVTSLCRGLQQLIDMGQRDFLVIHPLVATTNSPLRNPEFLSQDLKTVRVPLDTFWLNVTDQDYIVETEDAVISTTTASYEDYLHGNMIGHWLVVMYYYGWGRAIMQHLRQHQGVSELDFIRNLISYFLDKPDTLIGREHTKTVALYKDVFESGGFWGRLLEHPYDGLYWEYKSATCVVFQSQRKQLAECLSQFLKDCYLIECPDLVRLNLDICVDYTKHYPFNGKYDCILTKEILNIDSGEVEFNHFDQAVTNGKLSVCQFVQTIYHYKRKLSYWRCSTSDSKLT